MTNIPKHADLIHAFADGKVLQFHFEDEWHDWNEDHCPSFLIQEREWRIKPNEPKKVKCVGWFDGENLFMLKEGVEPKFPSKRIPELDREVTLPVEK